MLFKKNSYLFIFVILLFLLALSACEEENPTLPNPSGTIVITSLPDSLATTWSLTGPNDYSGGGTGAKTLTNLDVGEYTIIWSDFGGFETPPQKNEMLETDATITFTGTYVEEVATGTIELTPAPESLNASWSLAGPEGYAHTGTGTQAIPDLVVGDYTVIWSAVVGYLTPPDGTATLAADATLTFTGTYIEEVATSTIVINPSPDTLNAGWSLSGPDGYTNAGTGTKTIPDLVVGDYTVTWSTVGGYLTPSDETATLSADATLTFTGTYVEEGATGTVVLNPIPDTLNAGWSLSGPDGYTNTGPGTQTIPDLAVGSYTVTWSAADGYVTPSSETATLSADVTLTFTGTYVEEAATGTIVINPIPDTLSAGWALSGPDGYTNTGTGTQTIPDLAAGDYTVTWSSVIGYVTPANEAATLSADATITFSATYLTGFGNININPEPDSINAQWTVTGPNGFNEVGNGNNTLYHQLIGEYMVSWGDVPHYTTPAVETIQLGIDSTISFTGDYIAHIPGQITVDPDPDEIVPTWNLSGPDGFSYEGTGEMTITDLWPGEYSLAWGEIVNWVSPDDTTIELESNGGVVLVGTYLPLVAYGTIVIDIYPDDIGASWDLSGPNGFFLQGESDASIGNMLVGEYSLVYGEVYGYFNPPNLTQTLVADGIISFNGTYVNATPIPSFVQIPPDSESMPVTFTMGSPVVGDETPHQVTLTGRFNMASTEVTNDQYVSALQWAFNHGYVTATTSSVRDNLDGSTEELLDLDSSSCQISFSGGFFSTTNPDRPVVEVSWYGSVAYCDWLSLYDDLPRAYDHSNWSCNNGNPYTASGYRLPTEAEWEFACRAGTTTHFNTGACLDALTEANYKGSEPYTGCPSGPYLGHAADVGSYPANQWGLFDIHGNVFEWCNDLYGYYSGDETDPEGAGSGYNRVYRGGSGYHGAYTCRSAIRFDLYPSGLSYVRGFRPVRSTQ